MLTKNVSLPTNPLLPPAFGSEVKEVEEALLLKVLQSLQEVQAVHCFAKPKLRLESKQTFSAAAKDINYHLRQLKKRHKLD